MDNSDAVNRYQGEDEPTEQLSIKQFEWYQVQTKVRELMSDILVPFNLKQTEQSSKLNEIKKQVSFLSRKLENHEFLLQRENATKPKYLELQDQKIQHLQSRIKQNIQNNDERLLHMQSTIATYADKIQQLNKLETKLDSQISNRIALVEQHKSITQTRIQQMLSKMDQHNDDINTMKGQLRNSISKFQLKLLHLQNRIKDVQDESNRKTKELKKIFEDIQEITRRVIKNEIKETELDKRIKIRQEDYKLSEKFMFVVDDLKLSLRQFQNYLSMYQPLYMQLQISETLHGIFQGKYKKLLCLFEQQKYAKIHLNILNMQVQSLRDKMSSYSDRIRILIYRNRKFISNLKVQKSLKIGQNIYEIRLLQSDLENQNQNKIIVPVQPSTQKIQEIFEAKMVSTVTKIKNQIREDNKYLKIWVEQLQQQSLINSAKLDEQVTNFSKKINQNLAQFQLYKQYIQSQIKDGHTEKEQLSDQINTLKINFRDIINFGSVINHIILQDEIDRQGIALYGLKSQPSQYEKLAPTIQLDPKCLACTPNNLGQTIQAFKMACLTYQASHIKIQDQSYSRQQILELSTNILDKLKQKMQNVSISRSRPQTILTRQTKTRQGQKSRSLFSRQKITKKSNIKTFEFKEKSLQTLLPTFPVSRKIKSRNSYTNERQTYHKSILY